MHILRKKICKILHWIIYILCKNWFLFWLFINPRPQIKGAQNLLLKKLNNRKQPKTTENDQELAKTTGQRKTIKNDWSTDWKWQKKTENDQPTEKKWKRPKTTDQRKTTKNNQKTTKNWRWSADTQKGTGYLCPFG